MPETDRHAEPRGPTAGTPEVEEFDEEGHQEPAHPEELLERSPDVLRLATIGLFVLAVLYTLYFARPVILPIVLAVILAFVLDPAVGFLKRRLRIPRPAGAGALVAGLLLATGYGVVALSGPASTWIEEAPRSFRELETKLASIKEPVEGVERATEDLQKIASLSQDDEQAPEVRVQEPGVVASVLDQLRRSMGEALATIVLMGFLLASGDLFLRRFVEALPSLSAKKRAVAVARHVRTEISAYLLTMGLINLGLGIAVGTAMWQLDMPNPVLWGVLAAFLNFVPYVGPLIGVTIVALVSILTFDSLSRAAIAPLVYFLLNTVEGSLVTPALLGRRLSLNPVAVLIALLIWGWMWGIPGALMAVPLVVTTKICCDHYEPLSGFGAFLGGARA